MYNVTVSCSSVALMVWQVGMYVFVLVIVVRCDCQYEYVTNMCVTNTLRITNMCVAFVVAVLKDVLTAFDTAENMIRMDEAHDNAGNDMMKMMQVVFPVVTQIQQEVIHKYGFTADGDGELRLCDLGVCWPTKC